MFFVSLTPPPPRPRPLSHLPLGTTVCFCEVTMKALVSQDTMQAFAKDLARRKKSRLTRKKQEKKHDRQVGIAVLSNRKQQNE